MTAPFLDTSLLLSSTSHINSMSILPRTNRLDAFVAYLRACTLDKCPIETSFYWYRLSLPANVVFVSLFTASLFGYLLVAIITSRRSKMIDHAFTFAMAMGCALEILGYVGRLVSWENQWSETGFLTQIVCLTIAPAFMAGGIYLCLRRIVRVFGTEASRIKPVMYTRIFIPCDVLSLVLQAIGGAYASLQSQKHEDPTPGNNIMVAGLTVQAFTLLAFTTISVDFGMRTWRRYKRFGPATLSQDPRMVELRGSRRFKGFLFAIALATILIFWRSVFRVVELSEGWQGELIRMQDLFIAFEGVLILVAVIALNIYHPAFCFTDIFSSTRGEEKKPVDIELARARRRTWEPLDDMPGEEIRGRRGEWEWEKVARLGPMDREAMGRFAVGEQRVRPYQAYHGRR